MSFLVSYLILHLCVSMHACNSRHLGLLHKEPAEEFSLVTTKVPKVISELHEGRHVNEDKTGQNQLIKLIEVASNGQKTLKAGSDMKVQVTQEGNKIGGWKNHGRSTMESKLQDSKEPINDPKENSFTEDVVVMDYAQPHRKPPIHNIEP